MEKNQVELLEMIVNEIGENIINIKTGSESRFFIGIVETPTKEDYFVALNGKEISTFFKVESIRKTKEVLKMEILTYLSNVGSYSIKFNPNTEWYVYARS